MLSILVVVMSVVLVVPNLVIYIWFGIFQIPTNNRVCLFKGHCGIVTDDYLVPDQFAEAMSFVNQATRKRFCDSHFYPVFSLYGLPTVGKFPSGACGEI